jgi:hypothetical protein
MTDHASPVLTTRNATLGDMVAILRHQRARRLDVVAPASAIHAHEGNLIISDTVQEMTEAGVTSAAGTYLLTKVAKLGINLAKLGINLAYLRKLRDERPDLWDANVNGWLHGNELAQIPPDNRQLMARSGIDRALLAAERPETDHPADKVTDVANPWARVQAHLLCQLASALRCQCVILPRTGPGTRIHLFGFRSDIDRTEIMYTSLLVQMWQGLAAAQVPAWTRSPRAWRRSWLLGFVSAVTSRVRAAEQRAARQALK